MPFLAKPKYKKTIKVMDLTLPHMVGSSYACCIKCTQTLWKRISLMYMVGIPAVAFSVAVARKFINQKRPYEIQLQATCKQKEERKLNAESPHIFCGFNCSICIILLSCCRYASLGSCLFNSYHKM